MNMVNILSKALDNSNDIIVLVAILAIILVPFYVVFARSMSKKRQQEYEMRRQELDSLERRDNRMMEVVKENTQALSAVRAFLESKLQENTLFGIGLRGQYDKIEEITHSINDKLDRMCLLLKLGQSDKEDC